MTAPAKPKRISIAQGIREGLATWPKPPAPEAPAPALLAHKPSPGRRRRPSAPVDELARYFPRRPGFYFSIPPRDRVDNLTDPLTLEPYAGAGRIPRSELDTKAAIREERPAPRGPAEIIRYLARRGIRLAPTGDGLFAVESERGGLDEATRDAINAAAPLLRAYLHGTPLRCALPKHVGAEPPEAVTLVLGGAAWCGEC